MAALNDTEILILGGWDGKGCLSDAVIFDVKKEQCQKVMVGSIEFVANGNQCA